jgi:hypothetical protein
MLETFCGNLADEAQLKIAIRLSKLAMPVWENHFKNNPADLKKLNDLITDENRLKRGTDNIDVAFLMRALEKIERSYAAAKEKTRGNPIPLMKSDATLTPMLHTCMQPLQNKDWDRVLPLHVRLVFTSVFNMLVWILYRRQTPAYETHIYVAINQASDVLLNKSMLTNMAWNQLLYEYQDEKRRDEEDLEWEKAFVVGEQEPMDQEDMFKKILGEQVNKDLCGPELAKEVLRQMREEGKSYWNEMEEFNTGTSITYKYNTEKQSYWRNEADVIVGSFFNEIPMTEKEMLLHMSRQHLYYLRKSGFEV